MRRRQSVLPASFEHLPRAVLRRMRNEHRTGVFVYARFSKLRGRGAGPESFLGFRVDDRVTYATDQLQKQPLFIPLVPGEHDITGMNLRQERFASWSFTFAENAQLLIELYPEFDPLSPFGRRRRESKVPEINTIWVNGGPP